MTAASYREYLGGLTRINAVDYQDAGTQAHVTALAAPLDDLVTRARTVMLARLIPFAPEDALHLLGAERGLKRYPGEPLDVYRARVQAAWAYWQQAGTVPGLVAALAAAGYRASVTEHFKDPDPVRWAEFSVRVSPLKPPQADAQWDGQDTFGGGRAWGYVLPAVPLDWLPDLIREVKPAHARLRRLQWSPRGRFWGGEIAWGQDRAAPAPARPGVNTGLWGHLPELTRTDSGAAWGEGDMETIYEMQGESDA